MSSESEETIHAWLQQQMAGGDWGQDQSRSIQLECVLPRDWSEQAGEDRFSLSLVFANRHGEPVPVEAVYQAQGEPREEAVSLRLDQPIRLQALHIPKPWGQEIWYTGVEQRGVCRILGEENRSLPLPWLLGTLAPWLTGGHRELVLLKILDPLPAEVWGDLYFELHEEKREVYVVTHVDPTAWPDGNGAIRFGFDPAQLAAHNSQEAFKSAYLASVEAYKSIRNEIDALLDDQRRSRDIGLAVPVPAEQLEQWLEDVPGPMLKRERELRSKMDAFTQMRSLRVGDVVKVPCYTPHALQHGVRTVEFQTPVYERRILSFAQKVLTQGHWDTQEAIELMALETPEDEPFVRLFQEQGVLVERIVDFDDFSVERWSLHSGAQHSLEVSQNYVVVMPIVGEIKLGDISMVPEQACLVPGAGRELMLTPLGANPATVLVARPGKQPEPY